MKDIIEEATSLDAMGIKELNLIAQDTSAYGIDLYGKYELPELIRGICRTAVSPYIWKGTSITIPPRPSAAGSTQSCS